MAKRIILFLLILIVVLATALAAAAAFGRATVRRSFPQVFGEVRLTGLEGPVEVYRDPHGIPHVYASNPRDLFFAQGYVHAQDRFWQMDFWRHIGSGRLSELFGEAQLETDRFLRTLGWARVARQELEALDPTSREILESYAAGVNAYLQDHRGSTLSLEYAVLGLMNRGYRPEPWEPLHSLTWAKAMAWDLRGNLEEEIERAILLKTLTPEQLEQLFPPYTEDVPSIFPQENDVLDPEGTPDLQSGSPYTPAMIAALAAVPQKLDALEALTGQHGPEVGSNSWVISGQLTASGKPLLANDPHLSAQMPSIWYEVGLHCTPKGEGCPYDVAGFSFAGAPGVIIGHNDRIAWGFTNLTPDVQDLYIEKLNPENPNQYEVNGQWVDMTLVEETIAVAGGDTVPLTVRYTRHGPVISETYGLESFRDQAGMDLPETYAVALRWTALEPAFIFSSVWKWNQAQNWDEFRAAAATFAVPAQNLVYADVDGNIGYQTPGNLPIRAGGDGRLPALGWTDEFEWTGYIPFDQLPFQYNPPQGYIVTANNPVLGPDYPYLISTDWDYGFRARRIVQMIEENSGPHSLETMQAMQADNRNLNAESLVPILLQVPLADERLAGIRARLEGWDYQNSLDSVPASIFAAFWKHLLANAFQDDLPEEYWPEGGSRWFQAVRLLAGQPDSPWWDDRRTLETENRDTLFARALAEGVAELEQDFGADPDGWRWGDLHTVTFRNASLGESGIAPIEALFNRGPYPTAGGSSIVNATSWDATGTFEVVWLPSMRMIVDLGNLNNSLAVNTLGQSGHAYHPHYTDMIDLWRSFQYHPMRWEREGIEASAEGHLRLVP